MNIIINLWNHKIIVWRIIIKEFKLLIKKKKKKKKKKIIYKYCKFVKFPMDSWIGPLNLFSFINLFLLYFFIYLFVLNNNRKKYLCIIIILYISKFIFTNQLI